MIKKLAATIATVGFMLVGCTDTEPKPQAEATPPPTAAVATADPTFDMTKVADNVYTFLFGQQRNLVVVTNEGVIVTDPGGPAMASQMSEEIKKITSQPVKLVIYSHNHWDHISGAKIFKDQGARILQHELAAKETRPNPAVVPADETFSDETHVVSLGGETIELIYPGPSHGFGLVVMRLPKERILHTVDVVTPDRLVFRGMAAFSPQDWIVALKKMEQLDFDRIVPGHGAAEAPRSAVTEQREYLEDLTRSVADAAQKTGNPYDFAALTELVKVDLRPKYGEWGMFDDWMELNVERVAMEQNIGW